MFDAFAGDRNLQSTYKPIFLKSLLDLRHYVEGGSNDGLVGSEWIHVRGDKVVVDLNFVATRFLKYYWDMEYSFKFRQSSDWQDANIRKIIRRIGERRDKKPPTREQIAGAENAELRKEVIRRSIKPEVMVHIRTKMPDLFQREGRSMSITLDRNILGFLTRHHDTVLSIINHKLVIELEKYNGMMPRIATKVSFESAIRPPIPKDEKDLVLWSQGDDCCFYCKSLRNETHFDHVIPYNFVGSNDVYNIVASCQECNCAKHDRLPADDLFDGVVDRNDRLKSMTEEGMPKGSSLARDAGLLGALGAMSGYAEDQYKILYESCEATYSKGEKFRPDLAAG